MNGFVNTLRSLGAARLLAIGIVIIGILSFFAYITSRIATPPMGLLYSGLDAQDAGNVIAKLDGLKIKYELTADGTSVMVPETEVTRLRMTMAEDGLPSGGSMGYEIFDQADAFGTTSFVQNINRVRALEGELARTIRTITRIASARVHLVLPQRRLFNRKALGPSASIVVKTRGGDLTPGQVRAIQHLVAAAVPNLTPGRVSVVDEKGDLLAPGLGKTGAQAAVSSLRTRQVALENRLKNQLQTLLEKSVGRGKVQVEVSADINFNRVTTNSELYDPDRQVVLSTQTVEENQRSQEPTDVGGDVSVANNLPDAQASPTGKAASSTKTRTEETTNFENSKIVKTEIKEAGQIKRLSVAVLVDGIYTKNKDGSRSYKPRSQDEMDRLAALVHSAIGYDADRGDSVEIVNLPFTVEEPPAIEAPPSGFLGLDLTKADIFRIVELVVFSLAGLLTMLFVVRPLINRLFAGVPAAALAGGGQITDATGDHPALPGPDGTSPDQAALTSDNGPIALPKQVSRVENMIDVATVDGQIQQSAVKKVGEIVEKHPDEAVSILRTWLHE